MKKHWEAVVLVVLIVTISVVNALAIKYFLFFRFPWLDMPMHFFGGFWLGLMALWGYFLSGKARVIDEKCRTKMGVFGLAALSALVFGILWEVYELGIDTYIKVSWKYDIVDTLSDICFDLLGSASAAAVFYLAGSHKEQKETVV